MLAMKESRFQIGTGQPGAGNREHVGLARIELFGFEGRPGTTLIRCLDRSLSRRTA